MKVHMPQHSVGKPSLERVKGTGDIGEIDMPCFGNVFLINQDSDPSVLSRTSDQPRNASIRADNDDDTVEDGDGRED